MPFPEPQTPIERRSAARESSQHHLRKIRRSKRLQSLFRPRSLLKHNIRSHSLPCSFPDIPPRQWTLLPCFKRGKCFLSRFPSFSYAFSDAFARLVRIVHLPP